MAKLNRDEKKVLEVFVTSATDNIYALKHTVPPEIFGAFGSFFSRNPEDLRIHLLKALHGKIPGHESKDAKKYFKKLVTGNYFSPSEALDSGVSRSRKFFETWYGKYSHKSIANTVWGPMVATNVSQLFARELAYDQLAFFIEQSTRYVKMDVKHMFKDPDVMSSNLGSVYEETLETMARIYKRFVDIATTYYKDQIPYKNWLKIQTGATLKSGDKAKEAKYNREINGKALDVARFLLPQATKTNLAWIVDARSTEFDIAAWKGHSLNEIRKSAELIEKHAGIIAPSLLKYTEKNKYYEDKLNDYGGFLASTNPEPFEKGVDVISHDKDSLNKVIAHLLKKHNRGGTFKQRYKEVLKMSFQKKMKILERITKNRGKFDEWVELEEDIDLVKITLEIQTDVGATRDWRRHQKWDRGEPRYTLDNGYYKPYMVNDMPKEAGQIFNKAMEVSHKAEKKLRKKFPHQAQYVIPMAAYHATTMSAGLDQLQYMLYTRSTPEGNFSYRKDAFNIAEAVVKLHPWMIGLEKYPKGKDFIEVYKKAPLKKFLPLQLGGERLHQ